MEGAAFVTQPFSFRRRETTRELLNLAGVSHNREAFLDVNKNLPWPRCPPGSHQDPLSDLAGNVAGIWE